MAARFGASLTADALAGVNGALMVFSLLRLCWLEGWCPLGCPLDGAICQAAEVASWCFFRLADESQPVQPGCHGFGGDVEEVGGECEVAGGEPGSLDQRRGHEDVGSELVGDPLDHVGLPLGVAD